MNIHCNFTCLIDLFKQIGNSKTLTNHSKLKKTCIYLIFKTITLNMVIYLKYNNI